MNRAFEAWVRLRYGRRYSLEKDGEGFYAHEVVRRMFETWCAAKGEVW